MTPARPTRPERREAAAGCSQRRARTWTRASSRALLDVLGPPPGARSASPDYARRARRRVVVAGAARRRLALG